MLFNNCIKNAWLSFLFVKIHLLRPTLRRVLMASGACDGLAGQRANGFRKWHCVFQRTPRRTQPAAGDDGRSVTPSAREREKP